MAIQDEKQAERAELDLLMAGALEPSVGEVLSGELCTVSTPDLPDSEVAREYVGKLFANLASGGLGLVPQPTDEDDPRQVKFVHPEASISSEELAVLTSALLRQMGPRQVSDTERPCLLEEQIASLTDELLPGGEFDETAH